MARTLALLVFAISLLACRGEAASSIHGILSKGNDHPVDERTSLIIPAQGAMEMNRYFELAFNVRISRDGDHFGYVATVSLGRQDVSIMVLNSTGEPTSLCAISPNGTRMVLRRAGEPLSIYSHNRLSLVFDRRADSVFVSEDGQKLFALRVPAGKLPVTVSFGKGGIPGRGRMDVAPMEVSDIAISLALGKTTYNFPLVKTSSDSIVQCTQCTLKASIKNFDWVQDAHSRWKLVRTLTFDGKTYPAAAPGSRFVYFISASKVTRLNLDRNRVNQYTVQPPIDIDKMANQFAVDGSGAYDRVFFYNSENIPDVPSLAVLNLDKGRWSVPPAVKRAMHRSNQLALYRPADSAIVEMCGYGYHRYCADINVIDSHGHISTLPADSASIPPRHLAAMGFDSDTTMLVYGGIGNDYGQQEFGSHIYNDLYTVNTRTLRPTKLLATDGNGRELAARSLVTDADSGSVLGLFYDPFKTHSSLVLKTLDSTSGQTEALTDSIPYIFNDVSSSADLLHPRGSDYLYAVTVHQADGRSYTAQIYALRLPVITSRTDLAPNRAGNSSRLVWIFVGVAIACALAAVFVGKKRPTGYISPSLHIGEQADQAPPTPKQPGIYLLGGTKIVDANGADITGRFSPLLRSLLAVIVLHSAKGTAGISNSELRDALWSDKSEESFINNRSVNVRKLRLLLAQLPGVELVGGRGNWLISADASLCTIDYLQAMDILNQRHHHELAINEVYKLIALANRGPLMPDIQAEWLDSYKAAYSETMVDTLRQQLAKAMETANFAIALRLASAILAFDTIDEEALLAKCRILVSTHRKGAALKAFNHFAAEYRALMGEDFPHTFNQFIS